jgi:DNA-binding transcriptional LysR family regulator
MKNVDIKQLALLCELMDQQSLTEAAVRLHITPSAASQSLSRLRELLGDELFIREQHRYQLTPYGEGALEAFRRIVSIWSDVSTVGPGFDPAASDAHIVLSCYDGFGETELADFYRQVHAQAPHLRLDIHSPANGPQDIADLRNGTVDVVCSHQQAPEDARDLHEETVKRFQIAQCCLSREHPRIGDSLSLAQYVAEEHLLITFLKRSDHPHSPIDQALMARGLPARRSSVVGSWRLCAEMLARTDSLVSTSTAQAAMLMRMSEHVRSVPLPGDMPWPVVPVHMLWHQRTHDSRPHRWLRLQLREYLRYEAGTV